MPDSSRTNVLLTGASGSMGYEAFLEQETDAVAKQLAKLLLWFHESPDHALLSVFCSPPTRVTLDDTVVGEVNDARLFNVFPVRLSAGPHVLALETTHRRYPDWVQACLRTHNGLVVTGPGWRFETQPSGNWRGVSYDDSTWATTGKTIKEGPPCAPDVLTSVHPFVDMQSAAIGIWAAKKWPRQIPQGVFRTVFDHPIGSGDHTSLAIRRGEP